MNDAAKSTLRILKECQCKGGGAFNDPVKC